jgi:hypothetical protein
MLYRSSIGTMALVAALMSAIAGARAFDDTQYPDWSGQWHKPSQEGRGNPWNQTKPLGLGQEAPLTPEYQAIFEASLAEQAKGGQGANSRYTCTPSGMPRVMTAVGPIEFVITPAVTFILFQNNMPRRIYTDGRPWPSDIEPSMDGYSIGQWRDQDGEGRYDVLEAETHGFKGPREFESSGLPLHKDNQTIIKERLYRDRTNKSIFHDEITTIDHALTRPWTVTKNYYRASEIRWDEYNCNENNSHVIIGKDDYFLSADGKLMPVRKDQPPPDLKYFKSSQR